jgi:hypothetical protein
MSIALLVAAAGILGWIAWRERQDPGRLADRAVRTGDLGPLLAALRAAPEADRPTTYHRVVRRLWDGYHRAEAARVARDLAERHADAPVAQFWLKTIQETEPEIAKEHLDEGFLARCFDPAVAAKCGSYG